MNNFAGIIPYHPSPDDSVYLQDLKRRFPSRCSRLSAISHPRVQAIGHFVPSALNAELPDQAFFLDGEIFNEAELSRMTGADPGAIQSSATLLHRLILEKGIDVMAGVNGQFLGLLIDERSGSVRLLNDHAGVQQLFYHQGKDFFLFASDIKFLTAHPACPRTIDWESSLRRPYPHTVLSSYRSYDTWFTDIHLMPEATDCSIQYKEGTVVQRRFWNGLYDYRMPDPGDRRTAADVMEEYMALLDDSVKIRTEGAGTAYSFLSGGLDSSAICAMAASHKPLESYSIITQTTVLEDTTTACRQLAKDLGFGNSQFLIPYHELAFDRELWKQRIWRTENPVNHTDALTKNLLHHAIRHKDASVPYVLTGTGSDQYNGGLVRWVVNDEESGEKSAEAYFDRIRETEMRSLISRDDEGLWRMRGLLHRGYLEELAGRNLQPNYWMYSVQSALHGETYSLLWDELRAGSAHGHSVRLPFLDYRFTPFIASVPLHLHRELFFDKQILRTPCRKLLPDYITQKGKAPSYMPRYDFRFRLFDALTSGPDSLLDQAFGPGNAPHPVVDVAQLRARAEAMKQKPEIYEWQEIMHIINLGILEHLPGKDEGDMDFERRLGIPEEIRFDKPEAANASLLQRLAIVPEETLLRQPLRFADGCALMQDTATGALFLAKNNTLAYEIEEEYTDWKAFLQAIDGSKSTQQMLDFLGISFDTIRDFFMLVLKEQILSAGAAVPALRTETESAVA